MSKKYTYEEVKVFINEMGFELLSEEYKNNLQKLIMKDKDGYIYFNNLSSIKQCKSLDKFHVTNPYTIQNIKLWMKLNNMPFELITSEYLGISKKIILKDNDGYYYTPTFHDFKQGGLHGKFHVSNLYTIQNIELWIEKHNKNVKYMDKEYLGSKNKITLRDKEGYYYTPIFSDFINNKSIPDKFNISNVYTIQNIKLWLVLEGKELELITEKWDGAGEKLILKDEIGYIYYQTWGNLMAGQGSNKFDMSSPYTLQNIKLWLKLNSNLELVSDKYISCNNDKLTFRDRLGYLYSTTFSNLFHNLSTSKFDNHNSYTIQNIELWVSLNNKNFKLISIYYPNAIDNLKWKCLKNGCEEEFEMSWNSISSNNGCPFCAGKQVGLSNCLANKNTILTSEWHPTLNGELTPFDVTCGCRKEVWWICEEGHGWKAEISNRSNGRGCPECNEPKGEKEIDNVLMKNNWTKISQEEYDSLSQLEKHSKNYFIPQKTFEDLRGVGNGLLSYDHYLPNINLLIEYQGQYHDGTAGNQSNEEFIIQQEHDFRKKKYAEDNNINFLEIWYWDFDNIEEILNKYLMNIDLTINSEIIADVNIEQVT